MSFALSRHRPMVVATTALLIFSALPPAASAFELFGIHLWGSKDKSVDVVDPVKYDVELTLTSSDKDLKETLEESSLLVQDKDTPVSGDLGLIVKARDDRDRLVAALYENARYGGVVTVTINGRDIDQIGPTESFDRTSTPKVVISVDPGPVFKIGKVAFEGDAQRLDPANYDLVPGGDASSLVILKAAEKVVQDLKAEGRPLARLTQRAVVADHDTDLVDITIGAESGPIAPLGPVSVNGQKTVDPDFIRRYSRLNEGKPYSPEQLKAASERLRKLSVFSSVTVKEDDTLNGAGQIPVKIEVSEGKHRYFGFGAEYSTTDGFGLTGYWGHRNLFGEAEALKIEGSVSRLGETTDFKQLDYSTGITFTKPGAFVPQATFSAGLVAKTEHTDSYDTAKVTGTTSIAYELTDKDTLTGGLELSYEDTDDAYGNNQYVTFATPFEYVRDARDNELNPTEGYRFSASAEPGYEFLSASPYLSLEGSISGYKAFGADDNVVFAAKLSAGSLLTSNLEHVPATKRFYAGGGGSVRGYAYQEISPYNSNGDALGGRSYALGSFEARIRVTDTIGVVPFLDAGTVSSELYPDFSDIRTGAGIGLRYATPFGPIRLDFAVPLNPYPDGTKYGIYAGIGQTF
ncbi:autotransporter assembly complex protein TamA [Rhizobium sp. PAMB 3182]